LHVRAETDSERGSFGEMEFEMEFIPFSANVKLPFSNSNRFLRNRQHTGLGILIIDEG